MKYFNSLLAIFLLLFIPLTASAKGKSDKNLNSSIITNISVYFDKHNKTSVEEAAQLYSKGAYMPSTEAVKKFPKTKKMFFWGTFTLNFKTETKDWILIDDINHVGRYLELYKSDDKGIHKVRALHSGNNSFAIELEPNNEQRYFVKLEVHRFATRFKIIPAKKYSLVTKNNYIFNGIVIGIILIMIFYNLFIFISFNDLSYIYYILFILFFGLLSLHLSKTFHELIPWINYQLYELHLFNMFRLLMTVFFGLFACSIINAKYYVPLVRKIIFVVIGLMVFVELLTDIQFDPLVNVLFLLIIVLVFATSIYIWTKKYRPAAFFVIATSVFIFAGLLYPLSYLQWTPFTLSDLMKYKVINNAGLVMVFLFSLALADRINIIKRERAEAQERAIENLRLADKLKDEFLSNTTHELQTPLHGIIGLAQSILDGARGAVSDNIKRDLELAVANGKRLSTLVKDILDFSQLRNKDITLEFKPVDFNSMVDVVLRISEPLIKEKEIDFVNSVPDNFPLLNCDENRLQQIMHNLVGNSIKFTESGKIEVTAEEKDGMAHLKVIDTGIGISSEKLASIFNAFEQADGNISRQYGGTGIGLTITKYLANLHGGDVIVDSVEDEGSTFIITMPLYDETKKEHMQPNTVDTSWLTFHPDTTKTTDIEENYNESDQEEKSIFDGYMPDKEETPAILVVDDDILNLQILDNYLSLENYTVYKAKNGKEALDLLKKIKPDLMLLDIMMPGISGYNVSKTVREDHSLFELPIILLTAKTQIDDIITGFESGANDYLSKPFDKTELMARVNTLIKLKKAVSESQKLLLIENQLHIAKQIQISSIKQDLPQSPHFQITARYIPMDQIGGDFYQFYVDGDSKLAGFISDVCGHGVPAAMITFMIKIAFTSLKEIYDHPDQLLREMNHLLTGNLERQFVTALHVYIDFNKMKLKFARGGHEPLYLYKREKNELIEYISDGGLIGVIKNMSYQLMEVDIDKGDRIILYTDCITEAQNPEREQYRYHRFEELIKSCKDMDGETFADTVIKTLQEWTGRTESFEDDLALVIIDI